MTTTADAVGRYRLLVDLIPDGVVVQQGGVVRYVNRALTRLLRAPEEELLGRALVDFVHPDSAATLSQHLAGLVEPGLPSDPAEAALVRPDGSTVTVESISVLTSWAGTPAVQAIFRDLTEHKQAQASLRFQAALVEQVSDAIIATNSEHRVVSWNPAATGILGVDPQEALGRPITQLLGADLDPTALARANRVELGLVRPDGARLRVRIAATQLADGAGHVFVCSDETARREAEQRFAAVVRALADGVVVVDASGIIRAANPAAGRMFNRDPDALVGQPGSVLPLLDEHGTPMAEHNPLLQTHRTGNPQHRHGLMVDRVDGFRTWLTVHTRTLSAPDGVAGPVGPSADLPCSAVASFTDITDRRAAAERLRHAATHDPLTGLANRALLLQELAAARERAAVAGMQVAVLFVDLDGFKLINDGTGHDVGDRTLRLVAERLVAEVRSDDVVARSGGDEFVVLGVLAHPHDAYRLGQRLLHGLSQPTTGSLRGQQLRASIGIVTAGPGDPRSPTDLLRDADSAMYQAKRSGGHQIAIYDAGLHADLLRRRQLGDDLRAALRSDRVWVAYQPLVDLGTGRWCGAEALARWTHPRLGPVPPDEFIPIAEQSDLIHALGRRVLVAAVDAAVTARSAVGDFVVSVNVSTRQLDSPNTCQAIADALDGSGLPAAALCLELTESSLADDSQAERALGDLRHLGVRTSIDDFGTGCSSLAQLRTLPVDELKIDRSFIAPVSADREARHLVDGIIGLAHSLGLQVVAEGVETAVQADILADLGCDRAQGYYYRRPAPLPEFLDALPPAHRPAT